MTQGRFIWVLPLFLLFYSACGYAVQIEVAGQHPRSDGSLHDFEVVDGDALSPGDRFQIIITADTPTYYAIVYVSRDGKAAQIFPQGGRYGYIKPRTRKHIPGEESFFTLDVNGGRELMFIVTSNHELGKLSAVLRKAEVTPSSAAIYDYLRTKLPRVDKLEITNTGRKVSSTTDQVSSSLVEDFSALYAKNPWPANIGEEYDRERVRRGEDNTIPEAVRRRTEEVRSLLKRPAGAGGSSSLRTVQVEQGPQPVMTATQQAESQNQASAMAEEQRRLAAEAQQRQRLLEQEQERQRNLMEAREAQQRQAEIERLEAEQRAAQSDADKQQSEQASSEQERVKQLRLEEDRLLAEQMATEAAALEETETTMNDLPVSEEQSVESGKQETGFLGKMLASFAGSEQQDEVERTDESNTEQRALQQSTVVLETDSGTGVELNEEPVTKAYDKSAPSGPSEAPKEAVVVLEAPKSPAAKPVTAAAPPRESLDASREITRDLYDQVASAIVSINTSNDPNASGFVLDSQGHIITAWHVIDGVDEASVSFMAISGTERSYRAKVIKYNKFRDLALLKLVNPPEGIQPISVGPDTLPDAGSKVRVFGQRQGEVWATDNARVTRISPHFTWFSENNVIHRGEVLQIDMPAEGREIGSLVTSMDYQMLAMKSFVGAQTGRTYAVTARMIKDFVQSQ